MAQRHVKIMKKKGKLQLEKGLSPTLYAFFQVLACLGQSSNGDKSKDSLGTYTQNSTLYHLVSALRRYD